MTNSPVAHERKPYHWQLVIVLFLLAVGARVIAAGLLNDYLARVAGRVYLIEGDADGYWRLARGLLSGADFALYEPPRYVLRMPGFPVVLASSIWLFGDSQEAARYFLAVLTSLVVFPVVWLATEFHSSRAALWAGLLVALMPVYVGFSVMILTECLFAVAIMWNLWACCRWLQAIERNARGPIFCWAAVAGLLAGLAVYFRPSWLLFPVCLLLVLWLLPRKNWPVALGSWVVLAGCLGLSLSPWGMRNQQVTGHFVLTTLWMGPSLYDGLRPGANGDSDMTFFEEDRVLDRMSEYEMNRYYKDKALQFVREYPGESLRLAAVKFWRFWKPWPNADQFQHPLLGATVGLGFLGLLTLSIWGGWGLRDKCWFLFLCIVPIVYFTALHMLFVSSLRYRLPAEFPLAILAGIGMELMWNQLLPRRPIQV
ncbi:MAG: glycosyltransferase family 39 protein [Planctomycetaceae bacterium]|nr:glycosyltransferase family 39 protein [Planctomycetaceae bacterium]